MDIKFHFVRETLEKKQVDLVYCSTENMLADIFTKPLPKPRSEDLRSLIGVEQIS